MACTTLLVGKNASYDGSTMIARNDDSGSGHFMPKKFVVVKARSCRKCAFPTGKTLCGNSYSIEETLNKSSAALSGSFAPAYRFENLEIHKVFLRFPNLNLEQNPSMTTLAI